MIVVTIQRTETLPHGRRTAFEGPDPITALRLHGEDAEHVMLAGQPRFALGSQASCDIVVDRRYVSALHALLERRENRIRVTDLSKNGIVFHGRYEKQFDIGAGDFFSIDAATFVAVSDEMRLVRPVLSEILGAQRFDAIDELLIAAGQGGHLLILSEPGNDQERLARAIHGASLRRRQHFVKATPPDEQGNVDPQAFGLAVRGSLWLDLEHARAALDPALLEKLLAPEQNVRMLIGARTLDIARKSLGIDLVGRSFHVTIPALRERGGQIATLLERAFIERRSTLRLADLADANQAALLGYAWPGNLEQLREVADRLVVLAACPTDRTASAALRMPRTTLQRWLDALGLELPLLRIVGRER